MRPLVLHSNDDGYASVGLTKIRELMAVDNEVVVVAPETEQSASSHSLSLHRPLRLREVEPSLFSLDGTPADCVYVALHSEQRILSRKPDLVISGMNRGLNLGQDAFYSGTVAAAREAALRRIPALASSAEVGADLDQCAEVTRRIALDLLARATGRRVLVSLNFPKVWNGKVKAARLGSRIYEEAVYYRQDPRGRSYLWLGGPNVSHVDDPGSDTDAFDQGFATVTSLDLDLTLKDDGGLAELLSNAVA